MDCIALRHICKHVLGYVCTLPAKTLSWSRKPVNVLCLLKKGLKVLQIAAFRTGALYL